MALKAKRLKGLKIAEVSGVDAPAHLAPGVLVMKAVDALAELTDEQVDELIKAADAEEEDPVETTKQALIKVLADHNAAEAERQRWNTLTPEAVDRVIKGWLDPVQRIERAADAFQEAEPALDRATAILKAVDADPELGQRYVEAMDEQPAEDVEKAEVDPAWAALEAKADEIQKAAPAMDRPTAIVKAADIWPDLAQAASGG